ncbi:hypothetical protein E8E13_001988 [Curvularia kusanoi]|uniref:BZIP domain-containing protein n=1 Tax=Curvularia kusanoi TaxID=90978 RepID=A0A9P4TJM3_CURKU|nr:hypothetical protein E8E13_001988 [Curvularia kusanoi]
MNHHFHNLTKAPATPRAQPTVTAPSDSKPKKPNSEVRKQQNRIASRNYREKRKRKLQQLQQLLDDGDDDNTSEAQPPTSDL